MQVNDPSEIPMLREIESQSDRGAALIAAGWVDGRLSFAIRSILRPDKDTAKKLMKPSGPLGAFATKAEMGYLLGLYSAETRSDLLLMAEIRNDFAHKTDILDFGSPDIRKKCENLTFYNRLWGRNPNVKLRPRPFDRKTAREEYIETSSYLASLLHQTGQRATTLAFMDFV